KINKQPDFESQINVLKKSLVSDVDTVFSRTSYAVYQQIFEPLSHLLIDHKKLKILPDGVLWNINFDLLLTNLPKSNNYRNYDYLIKDFIISYDYSTQLLIDVRNSHKKSNSRVLAFSYSNENTGTDGIVADLRTLRSAEVDDLPGSREEIKSISRFMDGDYFYGSEANEKNFKEIAHQYGILHLAVHGEISDDRPDESKLYLTDAKDSIQDNILHAFELYNLKLNAEMAVLSACNTGEGQIIKGEGIMNLGRAFTYAGVKSMVVTQWEVPDDITPRIVRTFYEGLDHGMSKSEALRNAKLKFLEASPELTVPPFYWGSFVLIGDDSPIGDGVDFTSIILGIIGLILCIIIIGFLLKRRNISRSVQG
ncbi:MAG: CHAT domain-containing protein, partial [Bacteroidota bacterium]